MKKFVLLCLVVFATSTSLVEAGYSLRWSPTGPVVSGSAPINVDLFIDETNPDTNMNTFGLATGDVTVTLSGVGSLAVPVATPGFDTSVGSGGGSSATLLQASILGNIGSSLLLGSFTIDPTINGLGSLVANVASGGNPENVSVYTNASGTATSSLDSAIFPSTAFNFEFTAVPEPGSLLGAVGLGLATMMGWRRRRKVA